MPNPEIEDCLKIPYEMEQLQQEAIRTYFKAVEKYMIDRLTLMFGRLPPEDLIRKHCSKKVRSDGSVEFWWDELPFLRVEPVTRYF